MNSKRKGSQKDVLTKIMLGTGIFSLILAFIPGEVRFISPVLGLICIILAFICLFRKKSSKWLVVGGLLLSLFSGFISLYLIGTGMIATSWKTVTVGNIEYSIPANWKSEQEDGALVLMTNDVQIRLSSSETLSENSFAASLQKSMIKGDLFRGMLQKGLEDGFSLNNVNLSEAEDGYAEDKDAHYWNFTANQGEAKVQGMVAVVFIGDKMLMGMINGKTITEGEYLEVFEHILGSAKAIDDVAISSVSQSAVVVDSSTETMTSASSEVATFSPQDVSDETIESIKTYEDYLTMYQKIIDDYYAQYEAVVQGTPLYSPEAFESLKQGIEQGMEQQKRQYGKLKDAPIVGKTDLVTFLKNFRDGLKEQVDNMSSVLQGLG